MAKTVKIKTVGTHDFEINKKTNGTTYVFASDAVAAKSTINLTLPGGHYDYGYYCSKNGNDLYFLPLCYDGVGYYSALTKIKNYYLYSSESKKDLVTYWEDSLYDDAYNYAYTYAKKTVSDSADGGYIFGDPGATTYNISKTNTKETSIVDSGGKDKYNIKNLNPSSTTVYIKDPFGNDKYEIAGSRGFNIDDYAGNDKYVVKNCTDIKNSNDFLIYDYSGNDNYQFDNVQTQSTDQTFSLYDYSGNDVYNLKNTERIEINDDEHRRNVKGNDKYTIKDSDNVTINDNKGKDKYVMTNITTALTIYDYVNNDSYTISGAIEEVYLCDYKGKDTYKVSNSNEVTIQDMYDFEEPVADSDKYTITNSSNIDIQDSCGKDTYNISGSYNKKTKITTYTKNVSISDSYNELVTNPELDNDKYNLTYVINDPDKDYISDSRGSNTYNIKNSDGITIYSYAESGKDTYNIISSENINIWDSGSDDDVYSVKLAKDGEVQIRDCEGDNDKLTISNLNKKNLVYMSNYQKNSGFDSENSLILFDKATNGYVQIDYMFEKNGNNYSTTEFGDGFIETVKAGKKTVDTTDADMINLLNSVRTVVAGWLNYHSSYSSVVDVLQNGTEADINGIIACFENNGVG